MGQLAPQLFRFFGKRYILGSEAQNIIKACTVVGVAVAEEESQKTYFRGLSTLDLDEFEETGTVKSDLARKRYTISDAMGAAYPSSASSYD